MYTQPTTPRSPQKPPKRFLLLLTIYIEPDPLLALLTNPDSVILYRTSHVVYNNVVIEFSLGKIIFAATDFFISVYTIIDDFIGGPPMMKLEIDFYIYIYSVLFCPG